MNLVRWTKRRIRRLLDAAAEPFLVGCDPRSWRYRKLEATVPEYRLPDLLRLQTGEPVQDPQTWRLRRRPELIESFRTHVYGFAPAAPAETPFQITSVDPAALNGLATRKEVRVSLTGTSEGPAMTVLVYLPNRLRLAQKRSPLFLGLNFYGNHTIHPDPGIAITESWVPNNSDTDGRPAELLRGLQSASWPVDTILARGYGLATVYYGDIAPDRRDGLAGGLHHYYQTHRGHPLTETAWGAIGAWAWGLSRAMDYLERDEDVDGTKVAVIGHSRLGKTALWAGAQDERFALVISNNSGCGGAALSNRRFGETVAVINASFPHWFCRNFKKYSDNEAALPVDQHELISLIAPRPAYIASAELDLPADPMGEFLATRHASAVYRLLGTEGLPSEDFPAANHAIMGTLGYHIRKGHHAITAADWHHFLTFADRHFGGPPPA